MCIMERERKKRSALEKRTGIQNTLEGYRRFDYDYIPMGDNWTSPDADFKYRKPFPEVLICGFWRTFLKIFAPIALKVAYGAKVTGREHLKAVKGKGALCVCNHISYLDTLFVRQAVGHFRSYHTMTQENNKNGVGGHIIRHGGMLPFSSNFTAAKNLNAEMERLIKNGKVINFYAEKAMWVNYPKPRPMKDGVFSYAVKFGVPVIPIFCTFRTDRKGRMRKLRINIMPVVFPDESLKRRERIAAMRAECEAEWKLCYENAYSRPLEYLPDRRKKAALTASADEKIAEAETAGVGDIDSTCDKAFAPGQAEAPTDVQAGPSEEMQADGVLLSADGENA